MMLDQNEDEEKCVKEQSLLKEEVDHKKIRVGELLSRHQKAITKPRSVFDKPIPREIGALRSYLAHSQNEGLGQEDLLMNFRSIDLHLAAAFEQRDERSLMSFNQLEETKARKIHHVRVNLINLNRNRSILPLLSFDKISEFSDAKLNLFADIDLPRNHAFAKHIYAADEARLAELNLIRQERPDLSLNKLIALDSEQLNLLKENKEYSIEQIMHQEENTTPAAGRLGI